MNTRLRLPSSRRPLALINLITTAFVIRCVGAFVDDSLGLSQIANPIDDLIFVASTSKDADAVYRAKRTFMIGGTYGLV